MEREGAMCRKPQPGQEHPFEQQLNKASPATTQSWEEEEELKEPPLPADDDNHIGDKGKNYNKNLGLSRTKDSYFQEFLNYDMNIKD